MAWALALLPAMLATYSAPAHADKVGLVARVDASAGGLDSAPTLVLTPPDGDALRIAMVDDGSGSDVQADDGVYSAAIWSEGDDFEVSVEVDGTRHPAGSVSWTPEEKGRDLDVVLRDGVYTSGARVAGDVKSKQPTPPPQVDDGKGGPPPQSTATPGADAAGGEHHDATSPLLLGLAALFVGLAVGLMVYRSRRQTVGHAAVGLPAPLLSSSTLGASLPLPGAGLSAWTAPPADRGSMLRGLVATLAADHVVVLAAPTSVPSPAVLGGPVYRAEDTAAASVVDLVGRARTASARPVAVVWVGEREEQAIDLADLLPTHVGGAAVLQEPGQELPQVRCERMNGGWRCDGPAGAAQLAEDDSGRWTPHQAERDRLNPT